MTYWRCTECGTSSDDFDHAHQARQDAIRERDAAVARAERAERERDAALSEVARLRHQVPDYSSVPSRGRDGGAS